MGKDYVNTVVSSKRLELMDISTGERIEANQVIKVAYGTKNFWKCYLMDFLSVLGIINDKQLDVFIYIVEHTDQNNNTFIGTYKKISADVNVSEPTIAKIMKKLQENNFIKRAQSGVWLVNPNIIMKGDERKRQILLTYYNKESSKKGAANERIETKLDG